MALMGEGRELRLGLSGARPDGACEKTTTHWPTLKKMRKIINETLIDFQFACTHTHTRIDSYDRHLLYKLGDTKVLGLHGPHFQPAAAAISRGGCPCEAARHL